MSSTLKTIAEKAGFSVNTVSRVLNDKSGVSEQTREHIKKIAAELNYRPNLLAKSMRTKSCDFIGVILPDINNIIYPWMVKGIELETSLAEISIIIAISCEDEAKEMKSLQTMLSTQCGGIIINPTSEESLELLHNEKVPFVVLDKAVDSKYDQVYVDNKKMVSMAIDHLLELGHRDIALITKRPTDQELEDRISSFKTALNNFGINTASRRIHECKDAPEGDAAFTRLWKNEPRPTALIIGQHNIGEGVIASINRLGVKIPDDLSVIVIGEPHWAKIFPFGYATVERPLELMGIKAANILINRIKKQNGLPPCIIENISARIFPRGSLAPAKNVSK
jgi:DNA-binding LacI/PurR family transcriptional regulator